MKALGCKDLGVDCKFVARGITVDEVIKKASEHAKEHHGIKKVTREYTDSWRKHVHEEKS